MVTIPKIQTAPVKKQSVNFDWEDLRVLVALAKAGNLSATAREMGTTHATVRRRVLNLEADLGLPLFIRDSGRFVLTSEGERILQLAQPMSAGAEAVQRAIASFEAKLVGPVRLTASEAIASFLLMPALGEFRAKYPDIDLMVFISQTNLNLARSDADIALRLGPPEPDTGLIGQRIFDLDYHLYCSRSYLKGRKPTDYEYIGYPQDLVDLREYKILDKAIGAGPVKLKTNHLGARIAAARFGLGIALLPNLLADPWDELVRVSRGKALMKRDAYLIVHESMREVPRIRACIEALTDILSLPSKSSRLK
ncbi:MAG: LysR family transcriptional regulator [Hyphomicrobiaceae bacterium]